MALSEDEKYAAVLGTGDSPLVKLMGTGQRPMRTVDFPGERGKGVAVGIWNLLQYETQQARLDAVKWIQEVCKVPDSALLADASLADEETKNQLLFRALRDPQNPSAPFASTVNELRTLLTPDERDALYTQYLDFVDERSPLRKLKSAEEIDQIVTALGKEGSVGKTFLAYYDSVSLRSICLILAERCVTLTKVSCLACGSARGSSLSSIPPHDDG